MTPSLPVDLPAPPPRSPQQVPTNHLRAALRLGLSTLWTLLLVPELVLRVGLCGDRRKRLARAVSITHRWARGVVRLAAIRVRIRGPRPPQGALIAANHVSYGDIPVIAATLPTLFLSKREIADWPFIGWLLERAEHPLTSRLSGRDLLESITAVSERLKSNQSVCIFLEGTTTSGDRVLQFNAPLTQPAVEAGVSVVPVAIYWYVRNPKISVRDDVAYWRDDTFAPHIWRFHGVEGICVDVTRCRPISTVGKSRRQVAEEARNAIVKVLRMENSPVRPEFETRPRRATPGA